MSTALTELWLTLASDDPAPPPRDGRSVLSSGRSVHSAQHATIADTPTSTPSVDGSERSLITRLAVGDEAAFNEIYESYHDRLWKFAYTFVRSRAVAQEVVHDVFFSLWTRRAEVVLRTSLRSFLFGAIRNRALNVVRHDLLTEEVRGVESDSNAADSRGADTLALRAERIQAVRQAIASLTERQRSAVTLRWSHEMRYEEVAEALGISSQAARTLVLRAEDILRSVLHDFERE
jgi:RNA polymerase sigma-70 factor (ECF subfamily)